MTGSLRAPEIRPLLDHDEPPPVTVLNQAGKSPFILICDHAANYVPRRLAGLGLDPGVLDRHIAVDIGALAVARGIWRHVDAPLVASAYSRLVIDLNRPLGASDLIPEMSDGTIIPGNQRLTKVARQERIGTLFDPYHRHVEATLDARIAAGMSTVLFSVHSFTPEMNGRHRPWHIGTANGRHRLMAELLIEELKAAGDIVVGDNEPYAIGLDSDYAIPVHGDGRGLPNVMVEIRQDLIADESGAAAWAERLAGCLQAIAPALIDRLPQPKEESRP